ncbi:tetratricopeptide repeat protein [Chryseobacterium sp. MIQD13]|uniref:tetratricopeptide repeat protein n=1 Tax=Chryseobacterium sp. MIQD13 TaxID=3422310 RepID=UPI003D283B47
MKKILQIIILIIALLLLGVIIKYKLFTDNDTKFYKDGWTAYENKQYDLTIFYLNHVDKNKFPDVLAPLGFSYFEKQDFENAIINLQEAHNKRIGEKEGYYDKISNTLGICYMEKGDLNKAKLFLQEAQKSGNPDSRRNLQILDSLEHIRTK